MPRRSALARVATVARKEVVDLARDRRTMLVTLLTAIAAGPIFLLLIFNLVASQADKARDLTLPVVGREHAPALIAFLERQQVKLVEAPNDYDAKVRSGDLDVVLEIGPGFGAAVEQGSPARVHLTYDRSRDRARAAIDQTESLLRAFNREWGRGRLLLRGVSPRWPRRSRSRSSTSRRRRAPARWCCSSSRTTGCSPR